jgi:hypothetical protein
MFYKMALNTLHTLTFAHAPLSAGPGAFPCSDFEELDANLLLSGNCPDDCLVYPVTGDSCDPQIPNGSLVVVNRRIEPIDGHTIAVTSDGLNHIKILERSPLRLVSPNAKPVPIREPFFIIGVVTWCLQPIARQIRRTEPVYRMTDLTDAGNVLRARFESPTGEPVEMSFCKEAAPEGMELTRQVLKR